MLLNIYGSEQHGIKYIASPLTDTKYMPDDDDEQFQTNGISGRECFIQRHSQHILFMVIWCQTYG